MVKDYLQTVVITKLVHGGQGFGTIEDGRKAFIWNALPGETVKARLTRRKKDYVEGIAEEIIVASPDRQEAGDMETVLATMPWSIMNFLAELRAKKAVVEEVFSREGVELPDFEVSVFGASSAGYRNKMEFAFWGDDDGLSLAHFKRGSHGKVKISWSALANDRLNSAAAEVLQVLNQNNIRASQLKSVVIRSVMPFDAKTALFVKDENFPRLDFPEGVVVYFSNPKSPASVPTKELYRTGSTTLTQNVLGQKLSYDVLSFFQVNIPIFEKAMEDIKAHINQAVPVVDMYAGVGTIGICLAPKELKLVEIDPFNIAMAKQNCQGKDIEIVQASTEQALEHIAADATIIVDPPRSGLHKKVVEKLNEVQPAQIVYLSCNPATQARDLALLAENYKMTFFNAYNFFPRTPHVETLAILEKK